MSNLPPISEVERPIVGRYYRVPCLNTKDGKFSRWISKWVPIMGPLHEDAEIVGFPHQHWHIDWRFAPKISYKHVIQIQKHGHPHSTVVTDATAQVPITIRTMVMLREMPEFPNDIAPWTKKLSKAFAGCRLKCGLICPHKGMPLAGLPTTRGVVTCPAHGLRFNVKTGEHVAA